MYEFDKYYPLKHKFHNYDFDKTKCLNQIEKINKLYRDYSHTVFEDELRALNKEKGFLEDNGSPKYGVQRGANLNEDAVYIEKAEKLHSQYKNGIAEQEERISRAFSTFSLEEYFAYELVGNGGPDEPWNLDLLKNSDENSFLKNMVIARLEHYFQNYKYRSITEILRIIDEFMSHPIIYGWNRFKKIKNYGLLDFRPKSKWNNYSEEVRKIKDKAIQVLRL